MFILKSDFEPKGDQPLAIEKLAKGFLIDKKKEQILLGATGTGKTFTIANVIKKFFDLKRGCVIYLVNNKNLVMQVFKEMQSFFPENNVGCYLSYFDYYRPEAYKPSIDLYIGKKTQINKEIIRMRLKSVYSLISDNSTIIVSSVAAIYSCLSPDSFKEEILEISLDQNINVFELRKTMERLSYSYSNFDNLLNINDDIRIFLKKIKIGDFYFYKNIVGFIPEWSNNFLFKIHFDKIVQSDFHSQYPNTVSNIEKIEIDFEKKDQISSSEFLKKLFIYPNRDYIKKKEEKIIKIIENIENELFECKKKFISEGKILESKRLENKVREDILNLKEMGTCHGIENYSLYFDERDKGSPPSTIFDFFPKRFLTIIDESHMTIPQLSAMHNTNFHRLKNLVENGFRLPSSFENRPLSREEFFKKVDCVLYVSATPGNFELERVKDKPVEQIIRPTGILDPLIEIKSTDKQMDDIVKSIREKILLNQKVLIYALTITMSEEISKYLEENGFKVVYIHSKLETFERHQIINSLRRGIYDVIVGINLLKEGIDLPEVSLVCILDADKSGFLRDSKSLIQIIGRASRNIDGKVFLYANKITENMFKAIEETKRRREIQIIHNEINNLVPKSIIKPIRDIVVTDEIKEILIDIDNEKDRKKIEKMIKKMWRRMIKYSKEFKFDEAISLRNIVYDLKKKYKI